MPQTSTSVSGFAQFPSSHSVPETFQRVLNAVKERGLSVFADIKFSDDARDAGLDMFPARMLIFGNPKAGTPVMNAAPTSAIDLPLKLLVWQDAAGKVWVSFNTPEYLRDRHQIPQDLIKNISAVEPLVIQALQ